MPDYDFKQKIVIIRQYLEVLDSETIRCILFIPYEKWTFGVYEDAYGNRRLTGHIDVNRCSPGYGFVNFIKDHIEVSFDELCKKVGCKDAVVIVYGNWNRIQRLWIEYSFDGVCGEIGLEAGVRIVKDMCEEILKIRGEKIIDIERIG